MTSIVDLSGKEITHDAKTRLVGDSGFSRWDDQGGHFEDEMSPATAHRLSANSAVPGSFDHLHQTTVTVRCSMAGNSPWTLPGLACIVLARQTQDPYNTRVVLSLKLIWRVTS